MSSEETPLDADADLHEGAPEAGPGDPRAEHPPALGSFDRGLRPLVLAALVTALAATGGWFAFDPGAGQSTRSFVLLGALYSLLAVVAVARLRAHGELSQLRPRGGDLSIGALVAFLLYGMAYAFHAIVTSPGTPREAWVVRVYMALGDPLSDSRHLVALAAAAIGALEELSWRGLVFPSIEARSGPLRAALLSVALFAAAQLPAALQLADPVAGPNPLLVVAALGCGAAWTYLRWRLDRLVPAMLSHALFSWGIIEFPLWIR